MHIGLCTLCMGGNRWMLREGCGRFERVYHELYEYPLQHAIEDTCISRILQGTDSCT